MYQFSIHVMTPLIILRYLAGFFDVAFGGLLYFGAYLVLIGLLLSIVKPKRTRSSTKATTSKKKAVATKAKKTKPKKK